MAVIKKGSTTEITGPLNGTDKEKFFLTRTVHVLHQSTVLEFGGACGAVRFGAVGAVRSAYYRLCAHARSCARLGFVHVADSCDVERSPC